MGLAAAAREAASLAAVLWDGAPSRTLRDVCGDFFAARPIGSRTMMSLPGFQYNEGKPRYPTMPNAAKPVCLCGGDFWPEDVYLL
eukprot:366255-Prorocentrum_minimum.AAC.2